MGHPRTSAVNNGVAIAACGAAGDPTYTRRAEVLTAVRARRGDKFLGIVSLRLDHLMHIAVAAAQSQYLGHGIFGVVTQVELLTISARSFRCNITPLFCSRPRPLA